MTAHGSRADVGVADLLHGLVAAAGDVELERRYAALLGYEHTPREAELKPKPGKSDVAKPGTARRDPPAATQLTPRYRVRLFGLLEPAQVEAAVAPPTLPIAASGLTAADCEPRVQHSTTRLLPLVAPGRLWPALKRLIQAPVEIGLDVATLTRRLAEARPLHPLPQRRVLRNADALWVVLDQASHLAPLVADMRLVVGELQHLAGHAGFRACLVAGHPQRVMQCWGAPGGRPEQGLPVPANSRVIVVSDLGSARPRPSRAAPSAWLAWFQALFRAGSTAIVISPVSAQSLDLRDLRSLAGGSLQPTGGHAPRFAPGAGGVLDDAMERLKTALACAVRVEPELLRAMRLADPLLAPYPELEIRWHQDPARAFARDGALKPEVAVRYRRRFAQWPVEEQRRVLHVLRDHHAAEHRAIEMFEILLWAGHAPDAARALESDAVDAAEDWFAAFERSRAEAPDTAAVLGFARSVWGAVGDDRRVQARYSKWLAPLWAADARRRAQPPPAGLNPADLAGYTEGIAEARNCWLVQDGDTLFAQGEEACAGQSAIAGPFPTRGIEVRQRGVSRALGYSGSPLELAGLTEGEIELDLDGARLRIGELAVPWWALEAGRDREGAYVSMPMFRGPPAKAPLPLPDVDPLMLQIASNIDTRAQTKRTVLQRQFVDTTGPYIDVTVHGVTQRLRWIPPGEFLMGSPEDEPERLDDEGPRHRVILTEGFWLADTACTQALWQAVMGANPSDFKGDPELPVENVSWDDVQEFLKKLGGLLGGEAALPSEAQWEYACRAGTATPFWWGRELSVDDANYDGTWPYNNGAKGEWRQRTLPVKSFRPNPWGLWQMHGNVWEWCRDGHRRYGPEPVVDPVFQDKEGRALRGGSWFNGGGYLRSAYRYAIPPGDRSRYFGFRFLLRSQAQGPEGQK